MIASFIYGFGALVGGPLGDKIGEAKTIAVYLALSGLSAFIMLAAGALNSIWVYATALILISLWASLYHPTANSLISKAFRGRVAETMGLHGAGGTLGTVLTPTIAGAVAIVFGWPWAFVIFGVVCLLLAPVFIRGFPKSDNGNANGGTIIDALRIRQIRLLLIFNVMIGLFMKGVELFFTSYLQVNRNISQFWAAVAFSLLLAVGVFGQWFGGRAADKIGSKKVLIGTSTGVVVSFLAFLLTPVSIIGIAIFILLYGLSFYGHQPALNSLTGFCCPQEVRGAVYGIFFFTSFGVGSISQLVSGYVSDHYGGLNSAFYLLTVFALAALILSFRLPSKKEND
jgi:MFS family permease